MSVFTAVVLFCIIGFVSADPLTPYIGITWVTDADSLALCRTDCQNLCCPINSRLTTQGVNNNMYLYVNIDPQSSSKCGAITFTTYSPVLTSSIDGSNVKFGINFMGITVNSIINTNINNELTYTMPIPGGSGKCILDASSNILTSTPPTNDDINVGISSDADIISVLYVLVITMSILLFLA